MRVPILMYHKVAPLNPAAKIPAHYVEPRLFERHMRLLRALKFEATPLEDMFEIPAVGRRIAITFDDGYQNFHTQALPILQRYDMSGTVFLVSNQIGGTNQWDVKEGEPEEKLMTLAEIQDSMARGTDFGSHSADHADLLAVGVEEAGRQIVDSKRDLEKALGRPINSFCYPYGRKTPETETLVSAAGYRLACSTDKGVNTENTNPMALRRINVRRETTPPVFLYKLWRSVALGK